MQLGNQVEWALHAAATLAGLEPGRRLSAVALAEMFEVPPKYLAKALQSLSAAKLIQSTPGPRGGYALAKPAAQIRLIDVVDAVEGSGKLFRCSEIRRRGPCRRLPAKAFPAPCGLAATMWRAEAAWRRELESVTLADAVTAFVREAPPKIVGLVGKWIEQRAT